MGMRWYIVQTTPNYENKVADRIRKGIEENGSADSFGEVLVPSDLVEEAKDGQKKVTNRRRYPGYVFVEMDLNDNTWHFIAKIANVSGFVGGTAGRPAPMKASEIAQVKNEQGATQEKPRPKTLYEIGEMLRIKSGPFTDFNGTVESVDYEKGRIRVGVTVFGRETPVEFEFGDVEKV